KYAITGDVDSAFSERVVHAPGTQAIAILVLILCAVDLTATFILKSQDDRLRKTAVAGVCRIDRTKTYEVINGEYFTAFAWCTVIDEAGGEHPTYFYGKWTRYPEEIRQDVLRNHMPTEMSVDFDPNFPRRFWIPGEGEDVWSGWRLSQEVTACALFFSLIVLITRNVLFYSSLPLEICPLLGATMRLLFAGLMMWGNHQTALPPF
ncbi:MAG: hypothetical protein KDA41_09635, partial [Planctomycetales bacterium]|nr:hypothetical protein [Planctomycetales bacterium]